MNNKMFWILIGFILIHPDPADPPLSDDTLKGAEKYMKIRPVSGIYMPPAGLLFSSGHLHDHVILHYVVEGRAAVFSEEADIGILGIGIYICGHHVSAAVNEDLQ